MQPATAPAAPASRRPAAAAQFARHRFEWQGQRHFYWLYVPAGLVAPPPLVVMLHGCRQDAADFARGTAMNRHGQARGCMVLYPEQTAKANRMRCWNWFDKAHQGHAGEPAMIAALVQQVVQAHGADRQRVYIAGLSAGGAMAAVVAGLYPQLFAALGVHSGIPPGAATDVISAFAVMRRGAQRPRQFAAHGLAMPTLAIHGSADDTVHPGNTRELVAAAHLALQATGLALTEVQLDGPPSGERRTRISRWCDRQGRSHLEHWTVEPGGHAWFGGDAAGSFTDPQGPDASHALLDFFLQHRRA